MKDFRNLKVREKPMRMTLAVYKASSGFPRQEPFGLTSQMLSCWVQNFVTSVKLKSRTFIAGTTMSKDSSPLARTGVPMASTLDSI